MPENKNENLLPKKLPGAICTQWVRCGKPTCKCANGDLHGPYFYRFVWVGGRQRKVYVRQAEVEQLRAACDAYRYERRAEREQLQMQRQAWRSLLAQLTEYAKQITQLREEYQQDDQA
jgi:hypothetical protein